VRQRGVRAAVRPRFCGGGASLACRDVRTVGIIIALSGVSPGLPATELRRPGSNA